MEQSIGQFVEDSMTIFGDDVNKRRQLPLVYDGLKPAYRRLIYTALNSGDKYTKVAAIIGNCLTGDTDILTISDEKIKIRDLVSKGTPTYLFSYSNDGLITACKVIYCWVAGTTTELIKITLGNDEVIKCTPDHKFLTNSGKCIYAKDLVKGTNLMPVYLYDIESKVSRRLGKVTSLDERDYNHQVINVEYIELDKPEYVYNLEVDSDSHIYSLGAGVFTFNCIATVHPHGSQSLEQPVSNLVRWSVFDGHGNHGAKTIMGDDIEKSAPRYIGARISDQYRKFFSELMPYVPYDEAEMEGNVEPRYLPTPYPICLTHGTLGIGQGVNCRIPAFTMKSLHEAYINNDPNLLEAPFGLILDKSKSQLQELWDTGLGRLVYKYVVYPDPSDAGYGVHIEGEPELFKPLLDEIDEQVEWGRCYTIDMTSESGSKLFIGKNKGVRAIGFDEILEMANRAATWNKTFRLTVADEDNFYLIPLKEWLDKTYNNYINLVETYKVDQINRLKFDYKVYDWLSTVTEILINNRDYTAEDIVAEINNDECDIDVVKAILRKSINTLRNSDSTDKLKSIKKSIKSFQSLDPVNRINEIINQF